MVRVPWLEAGCGRRIPLPAPALTARQRCQPGTPTHSPLPPAPTQQLHGKHVHRTVAVGSSPPDFPPWPGSSDRYLKRPTRPSLQQESVSPSADAAARPHPASAEARRPRRRRKPAPSPPPPPPRRTRSGSAACEESSGATKSGSSGASGGHDRLPAHKPATRVLGVDFGTKWTGLAVGRGSACEALQVVASGRSTADLARQLVAMAQERQLGGIVIGLPVNPMKGNSLTDPSTDTYIARRCRSLANTLAIVAQTAGIDVYLYDEQGTSADARTAMGISSMLRLGGFDSSSEKQRHEEDALSAMMLVRRYLNAPGRAVRVRFAPGGPPPSVDEEDGMADV